MRWTACLVIAGLLVACNDAATGPKPADANVDFKVDRSSEVITIEDIGYVGFIECANDGQGELMEYRGMWTWNRTILDTPSGNQQRTNDFGFSGLPEGHDLYMGPDYVLIGLTSGDVWAVDDRKTKAREKSHVFADGSWGYHQTWNMFLDRADGETLHVQGTYRMKREADGTWKMYHVNQGACPEIW
jgi:hypothetical protein